MFFHFCCMNFFSPKTNLYWQKLPRFVPKNWRKRKNAIFSINFWGRIFERIFLPSGSKKMLLLQTFKEPLSSKFIYFWNCVKPCYVRKIPLFVVSWVKEPHLRLEGSIIIFFARENFEQITKVLQACCSVIFKIIFTLFKKY